MSALLTVREFSKKYGSHETQLTRDAAASKIPGAVRNQAGHWMLPDKPPLDQNVFAGLPNYAAMDWDALRVRKLALECTRTDMDLRERQGALISRGEHMELISAASQATLAALKAFPPLALEELQRLCPQLPAGPAKGILERAIDQIKSDFLTELKKALKQ